MTVPKGKITQPEMQPGKLLSWQAVPPFGLAQGRPKQPARRFRPAVQLLPPGDPGCDAQVAAIRRQSSEHPTRVVVLAELQLGLGEQSTRADGSRIQLHEAPGRAERLDEPMLGQETAGEHANRGAV